VTRRLLASLALLCALLPGAARAESVFSINLLGERFEAGDARLNALGGYVQVLDDSLAVLQYNPATAAWAKKVTFGVAGYVTRDNSKSASYEQKTSATKISNIAFAFPLFSRRLSASFGYRGRYDPDATFVDPMVTSEGDAYNNRFERSGGLWTVPFGVAFDLGRYAKLGGYWSLERGTIQNRWIVDFEGQSTADAVSTQDREFTGNGWGVGAVLRPHERVLLAATYEGGTDYDVLVAETHTNSTANTRYDESMTVPDRWVVSLSYRVTNAMTLFGGASLSDFETFRGLDFPVERLAREELYALGIEYRARGGSFPLRAGVRREQLPYTLPAGENVTRTAVSFGTGLLFRGRRGKLDLALQIGRTGSLDSNGFEDRFVRFYVSVAAGEEWRRKRERDF
jgi:hypothetical protein